MFLFTGAIAAPTNCGPRRRRSGCRPSRARWLNAGIGIGGIIGGLLAGRSRPPTFELLYILDSATFVVFIAILLRLKDVGLRPPVPELGAPKAGYTRVLKDKVFVRMLALGSFLVVIGYSQLESGFPAFVTRDGGVSTRVL